MPEKPNGSKMASSKCRWPELSPSPLIIAHRGASGVAPENTCLALDTAINLGADMVEVDVQMSRDACPVMIDIPRMLVAWRKEAPHSWIEKLTFKLTALGMTSPLLYRLGVLFGRARRNSW